MADPSLPVDKGWAWVILAGTFTINVLVLGCHKSFGLLYAEFLEYFQAGAGETAWILSLTLFLLTLLGIFSSALGRRFGYRSVIMVGSVVTSLGYVTSAFVPNMLLLYLTYGIIVGLGVGLTFTPTVVMVSMYFDKRRSLANGVTVAGSGVGYFLCPYLMRYLIKTYTLFGTLIILGGINLNSCVAAAFLRPLDSFRKKGDDSTMFREKIKIPEYAAKNNEERSDVNFLTDEQTIKASNSKNNSDATSDEEVHAETVQISSLKSERTCCMILTQTSCGLSNLCDCSYLRDPEYVLYVIAICLASMSYCHAFVVLPSHAIDRGVSKDNVALLVSLAGLADLTGRLFIGWFADLKFVRRKYVFVLTMFMGGGSALLAPLATTFAPIAIYTMWYGFFGGSYWALVAVLLADSFGLDKLPQLFGMTYSFISVPDLLSPPILGWIKDATGSWSMSFRLAGIWMILAGVAVLIQPLAVTFTKRRNADSKKDQDGDETTSV